MIKKETQIKRMQRAMTNRGTPPMMAVRVISRPLRVWAMIETVARPERLNTLEAGAEAEDIRDVQPIGAIPQNMPLPLEHSPVR
jgi:hypothetical protein